MNPSSGIDDCGLEVNLEGSSSLALRMSGAWVKESVIPGTDVFIEALEKNPKINCIYFDSSGITGWDSIFLTFLIKISRICEARGIECDMKDLPDGVSALIHLDDQMLRVLLVKVRLLPPQ